MVRTGLAALTGSGDTGSATLEQQLAKNLYFPQDDGLVSKLEEAELALKLDAHYSKSDVLRMYLADVYYGHGFYGLPAAAHGYFGVATAQLSWPGWCRPLRCTTPSATCPKVSCASGTC